MTKRGMTRERWEEIKRWVNDFPGSYDVARELVDWIVGSDVTFPLEFDDRPRPVVIDGPGLYEVVEENFTHFPEIVPGTLVKITRGEGGKWRGEFQVSGEGATALFSDDGEARCGSAFCRVRKHVPAPEPPKLQEPLSEGLFWAVKSDGSRLKVDVYKSRSGVGWYAGWNDGAPRCLAICDAGDAFFGDLQLVRKVKQPVTRKLTFTEADALVGEKVRKKGETGTLVVVGSRESRANGVQLKVGAQWVSTAEMRTLFTRLDGTPCAVTEGTDPWEQEPTP